MAAGGRGMRTFTLNQPKIMKTLFAELEIIVFAFGPLQSVVVRYRRKTNVSNFTIEHNVCGTFRRVKRECDKRDIVSIPFCLCNKR